jgi:hypothetical protein
LFPFVLHIKWPPTVSIGGKSDYLARPNLHGGVP